MQGLVDCLASRMAHVCKAKPARKPEPPVCDHEKRLRKNAAVSCLFLGSISRFCNQKSLRNLCCEKGFSRVVLYHELQAAVRFEGLREWRGVNSPTARMRASAPGRPVDQGLREWRGVNSPTARMRASAPGRPVDQGLREWRGVTSPTARMRASAPGRPFLSIYLSIYLSIPGVIE